MDNCFLKNNQNKINGNRNFWFVRVWKCKLSWKKIYAKKIDVHLQKIGFLIIVNHGISKIYLNNISLVLDIFFNQNENFKKRFQAPYNGYPYGYLFQKVKL